MCDPYKLRFMEENIAWNFIIIKSQDKLMECVNSFSKL